MVVRTGWIAAGLVSLVLAVLGAVLPLLPTTPFVLLAAYCFSRSSPRLHGWLVNHRVAGPMIRNWRDHRAISLRAKILASGMCALSVLMSFMLDVAHWVVMVQAVALAGVLVFLWSRKTARG